jgi:KaiC/GvpD/RAD55 family RecA-like ATPase
MDLEAQTVVLEILLSNSDLFAICNSIVKPQYFDPFLKKTVAYAQEFFDEYHSLPTPDIIRATTKLNVRDTVVQKQEYEWITKELESFCRRRAIEEVVLSGPQLLEKGDYSTLETNLKAAIQVGLNKDLGISYFHDVEGRLRDLLLNSPVISTGWAEVDKYLAGGISRQELLLLAAASGVGKSIVMSNLGINLVKQGYNVIYISLELADRIVSKRFDSMTTGISQSDILGNINKVAQLVNDFKQKDAGELYIKRMPESTTTSNHILSYLKEFVQKHGFTPDAIIVDYLDLMASNKNVSSENIFLKDKYVAEELRAIGFEYDCAIITASQLNRGSIDAEKVTQGHIQGGFSKVQTCDAMIAITQTDQMRASGEYVFEYVKTRNSAGVGNFSVLKWDPIGLRVSDLEDHDSSMKFVPKSEVYKPEPLNVSSNLFGKTGATSLLDLMKT